MNIMEWAQMVAPNQHFHIKEGKRHVLMIYSYLSFGELTSLRFVGKDPNIIEARDNALRIVWDE